MLREYFNERAGTWDKRAAEKDTGKLVQMAERLSLSPGETVLDVGTGTGVFLPYLLKYIGESGKIFALDLAEEMLSIARAKNPGMNIEFLQGDVIEIPLEGEMFDSIVCYSSFPHFRDKPKALAEMKRVLKPGGRLFICHTSSREHINQIHSNISIMTHDVLPDIHEMQALFGGAGLVPLDASEDGEHYFVSARKY